MWEVTSGFPLQRASNMGSASKSWHHVSISMPSADLLLSFFRTCRELVQERRNSIAKALELRLPCIKPLMSCTELLLNDDQLSYCPPVNVFLWLTVCLNPFYYLPRAHQSRARLRLTNWHLNKMAHFFERVFSNVHFLGWEFIFDRGIRLQFCTEHGSVTAMLCAEFQEGFSSPK